MRNDFSPQETKVPQYSWWMDTKGRTWIILGFIYQDDKPKNVLLLELGDSECSFQPYSLIAEYIEKKIFRQLLKKIF